MAEIIITGTDNKGNVVFDKSFKDVEQHGIANCINDMHHAYPDAICIKMQIAYPDPVFVAAKAALTEFLLRNERDATTMFGSAERLARDIMREFIVKRPEDC